jgi:type II secretory pathway predicted ATPase ExeA
MTRTANIASWGKRLGQFRRQWKLSVRDLAGLCDNRIGKTTVHRICSGKPDTRMERVVKPVIAESLRRFLSSRGKNDIEIQRELCAIFNEQNYKEDIQPVLNQRATLPKAAQIFFGLRIDPFTSDPRDQSEVFTTPHHDRLLANFLDAIRYQGFVAAMGEVGSGKTILRRRVVDQCQRSKGKMVLLWPEFMNMEKVHSGSIAAFILRKFSQKSPHDLVHRADRLKTLLGTLSNEGTQVALGFDECHRLHSNLLTALKNFWELGSGGFDRYLGLVLFGQPHFENILREPQFREILERLDIVRMPLMGRNAADYMAHRIQIAGGKIEKLFEAAAITRLIKLADTPLALGNVANAALLEAFKMQQHRVLAGFVPEKNGDAVRNIRKAS